MEVKFSDFSIYNVDVEYLKYLHDVDSEVFYRSDERVKKPFLGVVVDIDSRTYFIPITSVKPRHKNWFTAYSNRFLIYEDVNKNKIDWESAQSKWIYKDLSRNNRIRHILGELIIYKMVPVPDGVYRKADFETDEPSDNGNLLESEYRFCMSIRDKIVESVTKVYETQMKTGKVYQYYCNFAALEKACDDYKPGGDERDKT